MSQMDDQWALNQLRRFVEMSNEFPAFDPNKQDIISYGAANQVAEDNIQDATVVAEQILERVMPNWQADVSRGFMQPRQQHLKHAVLRAITLIERRAELADNLGENAPQISAARLHPWAWEGAKSLWQSGHYNEAVTAAARKLNAEAQNKLGRRDVAETDLFNQAFSDDPPKEGSPRLRLASDDGGKTADSVRRGIRNFAHGCFAAIRNPLSHETTIEGSEQEALEKLAAFSVLCRWVDSAELVAVDPPSNPT